MALKTIYLEFGAKLEKLKKRMGDAESMVDKSTKKMEMSLGFIGKRLAGLSVGYFVLRGVQDSVRQLAEFDAGMRNVNTILNVGQDELNRYGQEVLRLQRQIGASNKELTDGFYQTASAGYQGADALKILEVSSKAAKAGMTDTKVSVDAITTALNAWQMQASKANDVADIYFTTVKLGKTTFEEIASTIATVAPIASAANIPLQQVAAAVATLTKQGTQTPMAMTQIRASIIALNQILGDGWSKVMTYQEALQKVYDQAGGSQVKLQQLIGRVEGVNAVLGLTGKNAAMASEDLKAMNTSLGAMDMAFAEQTKSIDFKVKRLEESFNAFTLSLTNNFAPVMTDLLDDLTKAVEGWAIIFGLNNIDFEKPNQATIKGWAETYAGASEDYLMKRKKEIIDEWEKTDKNLQFHKLKVIGFDSPFADPSANKRIANLKKIMRDLEEQAIALNEVLSGKATTDNGNNQGGNNNITATSRSIDTLKTKVADLEKQMNAAQLGSAEFERLKKELYDTKDLIELLSGDHHVNFEVDLEQANEELKDWIDEINDLFTEGEILKAMLKTDSDFKLFDTDEVNNLKNEVSDFSDEVAEDFLDAELERYETQLEDEQRLHDYRMQSIREFGWVLGSIVQTNGKTFLDYFTRALDIALNIYESIERFSNKETDTFGNILGLFSSVLGVTKIFGLSEGGSVARKGSSITVDPSRKFRTGTNTRIVPPGYYNDDYYVGLTSGERFTVTPFDLVNQNTYAINSAPRLSNDNSSAAIVDMLARILTATNAQTLTLAKKDFRVVLKPSLNGLELVQEVTKPNENRLSYSNVNLSEK